FRARGRLHYVGKHYLQFAGTGEYFLKVGADAPETLLAYAEFDGTITKKIQLKTYGPHLADWKPGDPIWKDGKGKGLIGAINYLSSKGADSISFLTYNAGGDGDNVWPFVDRDDKFHYDCSKLDQWQIVFDHAQRRSRAAHGWSPMTCRAPRLSACLLIPDTKGSTARTGKARISALCTTSASTRSWAT